MQDLGSGAVLSVLRHCPGPALTVLWVSCVSEHLNNSKIGVSDTRPVESRSGARETIIAGPYHNLILMRRDRDAQCVEREETWGGVSPHHPTMGLGKRRKLPHTRRKLIYAYFKSERSHLEQPFQYF